MTPVTYDKEIAASRDCGGSSSRRLEGVLSASARETHIHPTVTELIPTMLGELKPLVRMSVK
jgi:hypothetical protein